MRRMSFALTEVQFLAGEKTITRRIGWKNLKRWQKFTAIRKGMGLKKGEKQVVLGTCETIAVRRERLNEITKPDVIREGFPNMTAAEFILMFCKHIGCTPATRVTRIEFKRID